jgi:hypothetical protein
MARFSLELALRNATASRGASPVAPPIENTESAVAVNTFAPFMLPKPS